MASFIIREKGRPARAFRLELPTVVIGRADTAQLVLPNVSVSRRHSMIVRSDQGFVIMDLESQNGTIVNGEKIKRQPLKSGDEVQIGKFLLIFHGDEVATQPIKTEAEDVGQYSAGNNIATSEMTTNLSISELRRMRSQMELKDRATIIDLDNAKNAWRPGEQAMVFGKGGIPVKGFGASAELFWNGNAHMLKKTGMFAGVLVNGKQITEVNLKPGDTFTIGKSNFKYQGPS